MSELRGEEPRYIALLRLLVAEHGMRPGARILKTTPQSIVNWLSNGTEPRLANLKKIAEYFSIPVPALLLPACEHPELNDAIISALERLDDAQKQQLIYYAGQLSGVPKPL